MIAEWMFYAVAISLLLGGAALAVERACRLRRWPSRWIWALVLATPFLLPFAARVVDEPPDRARTATGETTSTAAREWQVPPQAARVGPRMHRLVTSQGVSAMLGVLWVCASASLAIGLSVSWVRMRRRSASWTRRTLDGTEVLIADDIGPAVIGFLRPEIVVPQWLPNADPQVRRLALTHEREHVRMRDPMLLVAGTMSVVLLPWNLPLWWQWRRLRFAIEVDCDARVLASGRIADAEYAEALLNVAERSSVVPLAAAAMCESASTLEERIRVFLLDRTGRQRVLALALLLAGIGVAAAATRIEAPAALSAQARQLLANDAIGAVLVETIADGDRSSAVSLIEAGADVNRVVLGDGTPLIAASRNGDGPLVNVLIERGADVDLAVPGDGSPLIAAATLGNMEIVATLVERGADVNGFVLGDETPLINASRAGNLDVVQYLVAKGADVNLAVPTEAGPLAKIRSPLGEALKHEHASVAEYLRAQGAR